MENYLQHLLLTKISQYTMVSYILMRRRNPSEKWWNISTSTWIKRDSKWSNGIIFIDLQENFIDNEGSPHWNHLSYKYTPTRSTKVKKICNDTVSGIEKNENSHTMIGVCTIATISEN